jgi:hypothetical protein
MLGLLLLCLFLLLLLLLLQPLLLYQCHQHRLFVQQLLSLQQA